MPELRIASSNLSPQTSFQKNSPIRGGVPAAFHLLPYYARRNELNILRELHAKLSDPQKKLHKKMLTDAILREQLAIRRYNNNSQYNPMNSQLGYPPQNNQNVGISSGTGKQRNTKTKTSKSRQKQLNSEKSAFSSVNTIIDKINAENGNGAVNVPETSTKEKKPRKRKAAAPKIQQPVSGLDLVQNLTNSINQTQKEQENIIINTTNINNNITSTSNNSVQNFFQFVNHGQHLLANQPIPPLQQPQSPQTTSTTSTPFSYPQLNITNTTTFTSTSDSTDLEKRRADFIAEATTLYNNKYRMLSRSVYDFYVKRLKITQNLDPRLLLKKDLEIRSKFELAVFIEGDQSVERLVEHGKLRRKLVTIEEVFDIINDSHDRLGHGKKMAISEALKQEYANITLNCVLLYMANCKECYKASQSQTMAKMAESGNSECQKGVNCSNDVTIEDDEIIELTKTGTTKSIDYTEHFLIGQEEIRCKYCHFAYFTNSKKKPKSFLRSHLMNFHKKIYDESVENGNINVVDEGSDDFNFLNEDGASQRKIARISVETNFSTND
uniref:BED-type domain-containing protein n=1 Tax=Meloidogyne hapla TaxID=6305 RepID=A0A1I8C073_MELHA